MKSRAFVCGVLIVFSLTSAGCGAGVGGVTQADGPSSLVRLKSAMAMGRWQEAWKHCDDVLVQSGSDADTFDLVAEVALQTNRPSVVADMLMEAYFADKSGSVIRLHRALHALVTAGRLFDAIELLERVTSRDSQIDGSDRGRHSPGSAEIVELRRMLWDYLVSTEQHERAAEQRKKLILSRTFDFPLLLADDEASLRRSRESASLVEMVKRYPDDLRPTIGVAKRGFDDGRYDEVRETLDRLIDKHPRFVPAHLLLGRVLIQSGEFSQFGPWVSRLPTAIVDQSEFWCVAGEVLRDKGQLEDSVIAYANAARIATDRLEPWSKLAALGVAGNMASEVVRDVRTRTELLSELRQRYSEFRSNEYPTADSLISISSTLAKLGRLWEAEAWLAAGMTVSSLSKGQMEAIDTERKRILKRLKPTTPWQLPEMLCDWVWVPEVSGMALLSASVDSTSSPQEKGGHTSIRSCPSPVVPELVDEASERGLVFFGRTADDLDEPGVLFHQTLGCGGGTLDFDQDGWPDLYLMAAGGTPPAMDSSPNSLFRNLDGQFQEVTSWSGGDDRGFGQGVAVGDVNEDGFDDLLVLNYGPNRLWINNGDGTFAQANDFAMASDSCWSTSAAIADLDLDGISDLVIANYCSGFSAVTDQCVNPEFNQARACSPNHFPAEEDVFWKGMPRGHWEKANERWNATPKVLGRGLGVVAGVLDDEPGADVFITNDMTPNHYWTRLPTESLYAPLQLAEVALLRGIATNGSSQSQGSMGIAVADLNDDQKPDFYVSNFENEYNTLHLSDDRFGWRDATGQQRLIDGVIPMVGFGTEAVDFDNNGFLELMIANGHVDDLSTPNGRSSYAQPVQVFQQSGELVFEEVSARLKNRYFQNKHVGRSLWSLDANRDGRIDIVATHQTEPVALLINQTEVPYHWVSFRLVAKTDARAAVGSFVRVEQDGRTQVAVLTSGEGYLSSKERGVRFGLGDQESAVKLTVRWPSGESETWEDVLVNRQWLLVQGEPPFELN